MVSADLGAVFDGPGEVRGRLRSVDWSATPLGAVDAWSPVLRTMVRSCLNSGFPIMIHWGPEYVAVYNDAFAALLGGKHPAALGRPARETWPESWDRFAGGFDRVMRQGRTLQAVDEQQIMHRNGYPEEVYVSYSHSPITDVDGSTAGVLSVAAETTAKVLYERRMRVVRELGAVSATASGAAADTCRAVLAVLGTARQTMPFAVAFLTGVDGVAHRVAEYGLAADAAIPGGTDTAVESGGVVHRVLRTGRGDEVTGLRERFPGALLPGPLGPLTPDTAVVVPLTVSGRADPVGALVVGVNPYRRLDAEYRSFFTVIGRQVRVALTDTAAYEAEREKARLLADLDRAKMEFFQNVSHELRTPLTLLLSPLQDLLAAADDRTRREREDLRAAVRAAERLRGMVDALLDFSGAEHGSLDPDRQPADLAALTADTASMFRSTADHAGLSFDVDVPETPVTAAVDRAMWSTIVTNLLSNAVKYTEHGGIRIRLTPTVDGQAALTVADTGIGIDADQQPLVFDRFHRAHTDHDATDNPDGGTGIGLAVVADLVHAHHGNITLDSVPGRGSTFTVTVPLDTGIAEAARDQEEVTATGGGGPGLLLVEDDADLRAYVTRLLTDDGWVVHAVPDAETALTAIASGPHPNLPDMVVTDVMLPGRSGLQLVADLRDDPATARLPVIVLTARHGDQATAEGLAAGADDYITKPFSPQELLARVRSTLELARLRETAVEKAETRAEQIRAALDSNRVIGTAVGIVMVTYRLTAQQGFDLLVRVSQHSNRKLRDIAADVTATGALQMRPTMIDDLLIGVATTGRK